MENTNDMQTQPNEPAQSETVAVQEPTQPVQPATAVPSQTVQNSVPVDGIKHATFFQRLAALLVDALLLGIILRVFEELLGLPEIIGANAYSGLTSLISLTYYVVMTVTKGATVGKMALKIKVQKADTGENLDWISAFLREVVGKFLSALPLFLGYFWMLWDDKKQTWHDKLASSVVVRE